MTLQRWLVLLALPLGITVWALRTWAYLSFGFLPHPLWNLVAPLVTWLVLVMAATLTSRAITAAVLVAPVVLTAGEMLMYHFSYRLPSTAAYLTFPTLEVLAFIVLGIMIWREQAPLRTSSSATAAQPLQAQEPKQHTK